MQNKLWMWVWFFGGKNFSNQIPIPRFAWFAGWRTPELMRTQEKSRACSNFAPSLDSSSAYSSASAPLLLAFFRQLVVTMDINSPRPRSKCQLKWRNTRTRRLYLQLSGAHAPEHSCEHSAGCGHVRIRTLSRAPGHAGYILNRTYTRKKARIDAK